MLSNIARVAALVAAGALLSSPAQARMYAATTAEVAATVSSSTINSLALLDRQFVVKAAQGGNAEISLARLVVNKSSNPTVKLFAQQMIRDHTAANAKLASIVVSMGGSQLAPGLSPDDAAARSKLALLSGAALDIAYLKNQVAGHQAMAALMQKQVSMGENATLKAFAGATLPTVQAHLGMAQKDLATLSSGR